MNYLKDDLQIAILLDKHRNSLYYIPQKNKFLNKLYDKNIISVFYLDSKYCAFLAMKKIEDYNWDLIFKQDLEGVFKIQDRFFFVNVNKKNKTINFSYFIQEGYILCNQFKLGRNLDDYSKKPYNSLFNILKYVYFYNRQPYLFSVQEIEVKLDKYE